MKGAKSFFVLAALILSLGSASAALAQGGSNSSSTNSGWLRIEVTNGEGQPLARACVTVVPRAGEIVFRKADRNGKVKVKGLAPGSYRVVVKVEGYEAQKKEITINSNAEVVAFALEPRGF
jgi:uncharacterized surface anchored protein